MPKSANPQKGRLWLAAPIGCVVTGLYGGALAFPDRAPPGHTGGFGEPTCIECHSGFPLNPEGGGAELTIEEMYEPGQAHDLRLELWHPDLRRGGFLLSARYASGPRIGQDAGILSARRGQEGSAVSVTIIPTDLGEKYATHGPGDPDELQDGRAAWDLKWVAPDSSASQCPVIFHFAGNAADDDRSPFGDRIYAGSATGRPARPDADC